MIHIEKCEINVTRHCNNHCACCNHASPWAEPYFMEPDVLRHDLAALKPILRIGFLCLQGGEPLLHPRIIELLDVLKESGIADQYGMLSNGRPLSKMPDEFFAKCGQLSVNGRPFELRVSIYANFDQRELNEPIRKAVHHGFEIRPGPVPAFWRLFKDQPDGGKAVWQVCYCRVCYTIHEGYFFHCPLAAFFPGQFFGWDANIDGIPIMGINETLLAEFLARKEPLQTCSKCTGSSGGWIPWHETKSLEEWIKEATA